MLESEPLLIYPRLLRPTALNVLSEIEGRPPEELRLAGSTSHPGIEYYATGSRVSKERLREIAAAVRKKADELGFPGPPGTAGQGRFDRAMPPLLYKQMRIVPADAASEGVWSFLTLILLPDVAVWRFPQQTQERLIGRPRNVFRRYWWRAHSLGASPGDPASELGEDQLVQIMERPSICGSRKLARRFARIVIRAAASNPGVGIEPLMRDAAKRLVRLTPFVCFEALPDHELHAQLRTLVGASVRSTSSLKTSSTLGEGVKVSSQQRTGCAPAPAPLPPPPNLKLLS